MRKPPPREAGRLDGTIGPAAGVTQSRTLDGAEQMVRDYAESVWQDQRVGILSRAAAECGAVRHLTSYAERRRASGRKPARRAGGVSRWLPGAFPWPGPAPADPPATPGPPPPRHGPA